MLVHSDYVRLQGVHPLLSAIVFRADEEISKHQLTLFPHVFRVTGGVRTLEEQREMVRRGASRTLKSRHRTATAVDLAILTKDRSRALWEIGLYRRLNLYMQQAAGIYGAKVTWGGDWSGLVDGCHWQLEDVSPLVAVAA